MRILDYYTAHSGQWEPRPAPGLHRFVIVKRLNRVLEFTGLTIDDVVNCPISKNKVRSYYKLSKLIDCKSEIVELEKQWNPSA
jgi:hypothetical protein